MSRRRRTAVRLPAAPVTRRAAKGYTVPNWSHVGHRQGKKPGFCLQPLACRLLKRGKLFGDCIQVDLRILPLNLADGVCARQLLSYATAVTATTVAIL